MKCRNLLVSVMLGCALAASPAMAKKKAKDIVVEKAPVALSTSVNTDMSVEPENILLLDLSNGGRVAIRLMPSWAPGHVERIKTLTQRGFYNGVVFHRVIDGFMAQTGDPKGTGEGGSDLPDLKAEFNMVPHMRGSVSMARTNEPDSANSQFFIVFFPRFALDKRYTNFGRVISGMQYVDTIERGEPPQNPTRILQASLASEGKAQMMPPPPAPPVAEAPVPAPAALAVPPAKTAVKAAAKKN
ncbi:peptidylprolyl isomerase [Novosphingobium sp. TH158]|uniref:peptidylprolyl isomerase n=1 Tax=Novosphingobium sp. TH158 TaxID=2067455 RepID=UPI000C7D5454|nr:peptidylprolyl isomerase [Novosphingobium sp. TH158]PLK25990.1 peptidylprolyl isomerase [Novosphingobium sp. TH158]